jgi:cobalt/nickel transport system permease protein
MSTGHLHPDSLYVPGDSPVHRCRPEVKVAATVAFILAVVATPREAFWAFGLHATLVGVVVAVSRLSPGLVARRMRIELPFVAFAVFLPLVGSQPRVDVLGVSLSEPGLWAAWNIVVKGTLGVAASVMLSATTTVPDLLRGLERLRVPRVVTAIAGFMVRYLEIVTSEAHRMHVARQSRGYDPRWIWQARGFAASAGALFVRAYERGERVYLAMASRGYDGTMPDLAGAGAAASPVGGPAGGSRRRAALWGPAAVVPLCAWIVAAGALVAA